MGNITRSILILKSMCITFQSINSMPWLSGQMIVGEKCFWKISLIKTSGFIFRKFFFWEKLSFVVPAFSQACGFGVSLLLSNHFLCICSVRLCSCCCKKKQNKNIIAWHRAPFLRKESNTNCTCISEAQNKNGRLTSVFNRLVYSNES